MRKFSIEKFGFVILCPQRNLGGLKSTVYNIQCHYPDKPCICVVGDDATKEELQEFGELCPTIQAGKTYSSMINLGLRKSKSQWSMLYMAGMRVCSGLMRRYQQFCGDKKHIMYQVIDRKWKFNEASINGMFLHKDAMEDCGDFVDDEEDFEAVKLFWAANALRNGYQFRALVGVPR